MAYERIFEKPYEDGYEDLPLETTPVTARTLNDKDDAIEHIEDYLETAIEANPTLQGGESNLTALKVEGTIYKIAGGGGGGTAEDITYDNTETGMTADNVQDAIDEVFQYGNNRKSQLVDKIVAKGGESSTSESWDNVIEDIDTIPSGGGSIFLKTMGVFNAGTQTFTATESGKHIFLVFNSYQGSSTITLPRTAIVEDFIRGSGNRDDGLRIAICELQVGDVVTIQLNSHATYNACGIYVGKLNIPDFVGTNFYKGYISDTFINPTMPTDLTKKYLVVSMCGGRLQGNFLDYTHYYDIDRFYLSSAIGYNCHISIQYGADNAKPSLYGYDGGGAGCYIYE